MRRLARVGEAGLFLLLPALVLLAGAAVMLRAAQPSTWPITTLIVAASFAPLISGLLLQVTRPGSDLVLLSICGMLTSISVVSLLQVAGIPGGPQAFFQTILVRHLVFVIATFAAMAAGVFLSTYAPLVHRYPYLTAVMALALIASTMVLGTEVNGARLWIVLGPVRAQPAEVARVLLTLFIAAYLYDRRHLLASSWLVGRLELPPIPYLIPIGGALLLALSALALQNDLGMAALTTLATVAIVTAGLRSRWSVVSIVSVLAAVIWIAPGLSPRVQSRVANWLDPWQAPTGSGYQFIQGEYALALGGLGGGRVTPDVRNVPEVQTDFVLAAIGAQSGVLATASIVALLAVCVLRCAQNALLARTELAKGMALALTVLIGLQTMLILGGVLRLLPLTGLTVPFVSYGGTSMLVSGFSVGIIIGFGNTRATPPRR